MTKEEFKEKFKVGDRITRADWLSDWFCEIKYIGKDCIVTFEQDGKEVFYENRFSGWQHYKEPVKKDLKRLKKYYQIFQNGTCVDFVGYREIKPEEKGRVFITEEEAIERGLRI